MNSAHPHPNPTPTASSSEGKERVGKPVRLQLSRKTGFDLQAHSRAVNGLPAVVVARPTKWGNPFTVINTGLAEEHQSAVDRFRKLFQQAPSRRRHLALTILKGNAGRGEAAVVRMRENLPLLRGRNLACWCVASCPCHADVLLELANGPVCEALPASIESQKEGAADSASVKERA